MCTHNSKKQVNSTLAKKRPAKQRAVNKNQQNFRKIILKTLPSNAKTSTHTASPKQQRVPKDAELSRDFGHRYYNYKGVNIAGEIGHQRQQGFQKIRPRKI